MNEMSMPPVNPLQQSETAKNYFDRLVEDVRPAFESQGIELNFAGYHQLRELNKSLTPYEGEKAWYIAQGFLEWEDYFVGCLGVTEKLLLDSETSKQEILAEASFRLDPKTVNNGNRLANGDSKVVESRRIRNAYQSFHNQLKSKIKACQTGHFMAKKTWEIAVMREQTHHYQQRNGGPRG